VSHFLAVQKQFPIGQGGLHLTQLFRYPGENNPFSFVFDCGGCGSPAALKRQMSMLRKVLRVEKGVRHIDLMAISHLHRDHINGFELLVGATSLTIGTLLLPHYDEADIALILANAAADGASLEELTTLDDALRNPERWFGDRGVQQIRFVTPSEGGDGIGVEPPDTPEEGAVIFGTSWVIKFTPREEKSSLSRVTLASSQTGPNSVFWQFMPYARRQTPSTAGHGDRATLKQDVDRLLPSSVNGPPLLNIARQNAKKLIADLGDAYRRYCPERSWNPISLTLASGTSHNSYGYNCCYMRRRDFDSHCWHGRHDAYKGQFWMHTGDAALCGKDGMAWSNYFNKVLPLTTVFQAPHHGSRNNLDVTTVAKLPLQRAIAYATCRNNDRKHPHPTIRTDVNARGLELLEITQSPHSEFVTFTEIIAR
jgi:hypothetical protein